MQKSISTGERGSTGRPKALTVKDHYVSFRVTAEEHFLLMDKARRSGMGSPGEFARSRALRGIARGRKEPPTPQLFGDLTRDIFHELRRQGVNLNQIAHRCNREQVPPAAGARCPCSRAHGAVAKAPRAMIIRIQESGGSFRGAGLYCLHDKAASADLAKHLKPITDERVWFTDTRNCVSFDPELALDEMWRTAEDQAYLKVAAGVRTSGRRCDDPVKTISMSWHKEDQPTPQHMIDAADEYMRHMGWEAHQAVYVGHNDTEHRHIHIILNRVHPETGRTLDDYREKIRSQEWALAYQKEHGQEWCPQREINAEIRAEHSRAKRDRARARERQPANDHLPHNVVMICRPFERDFTANESRMEDHDKLERDLLKEQQKAERIAFFSDGRRLFKATRHAIYDEVRTDHKKEWAQYYKDKKAAGAFAELTAQDALVRAFHFARQGDWERATSAYGDRYGASDDIHAELAQRKQDIIGRQKAELRTRQKDACDILREQREAEYLELKQRQQQERDAMRLAHGRGESASQLVAQTLPVTAANQNLNPEARPPEPANANAAPQDKDHAKKVVSEASQAPVALTRAMTKENSTVVARDDQPKPAAENKGLRLPTDAVAQTIGAVANYIADQLGELFAPTPPEVREAREQSKQDTDKAPVDEKPNDAWERRIAAAIQLAEEEREQKRSRDYWTERREAGRDR